MSGPPDRPGQSYPPTPPYAPTPWTPPPPPAQPHRGHHPPSLPPLPPRPVGPRPWSGGKVLLVVWGATALAGPVVGAAAGTALAAVLAYAIQPTGALPADIEAIRAVIGASLTFAVLLGGMVGGAVGIGTGLVGGGVAALLTHRVGPALTALAAAAAAAAGPLLLVLLLLGAAVEDSARTAVSALLVPVLLVLAAEFGIVLVTVRRAVRWAGARQVARPDR